MPLCSLNLFIDVYDDKILAETNTAGCPSRFLIGTDFQRFSFCVWALELRPSNTAPALNYIYTQRFCVILLLLHVLHVLLYVACV